MNAEDKFQVIPEQPERSERTAVSPPGTQAILPHVPGKLSDQDLEAVAGGAWGQPSHYIIK